MQDWVGRHFVPVVRWLKGKSAPDPGNRWVFKQRIT